jgi:hypothetical protein
MTAESWMVTLPAAVEQPRCAAVVVPEAFPQPDWAAAPRWVWASRPALSVRASAFLSSALVPARPDSPMAAAS